MSLPLLRTPRSAVRCRAASCLSVRSSAAPLLVIIPATISPPVSDARSLTIPLSDVRHRQSLRTSPYRQPFGSALCFSAAPWLFVLAAQMHRMEPFDSDVETIDSSDDDDAGTSSGSALRVPPGEWDALRRAVEVFGGVPQGDPFLRQAMKAHRALYPCSELHLLCQSGCALPCLGCRDCDLPHLRRLPDGAPGAEKMVEVPLYDPFHHPC